MLMEQEYFSGVGAHASEVGVHSPIVGVHTPVLVRVHTPV